LVIWQHLGRFLAIFSPRMHRNGYFSWHLLGRVATSWDHNDPVYTVNCCFTQIFDCTKIILLLGEEAVASPSIGNTLWRIWTMFTRPAITQSEVNKFGWNLWHSEHIVRSWTWQILGAIRAEARAEQRAEIVFCKVNNARLYKFPVSQISRNLHTTCGSERWFILLENNLSVRGLFFQKGHLMCERRQWFPTSGRDFSEMNTNLGKSQLVGTPTECWLSIHTVGINSKSFPWLGQMECYKPLSFLTLQFENCGLWEG